VVDLSGPPGAPLAPEDRIELHELAAAYGDAVDERDWAALSRVFTDDAVFQVTGIDGVTERHEGWPAIERLMFEGPHPVAHHVTNVRVEVDTNRDTGGSVVRLRFKVIAPGPRGRVGSAVYRDVVVRTADGWRIREHLATIIRPRAPQGPEGAD
jgi:ketosteroid isomerase-like protein